MIVNGITIPEKALRDFARRHRVVRLAVFGSILGDDFKPASDIDMLVEFEPGARVSLLDMGGMVMELQSMLGREVDLRTLEDLSPYFRSQVQREARVLYAA